MLCLVSLAANNAAAPAIVTRLFNYTGGLRLISPLRTAVRKLLLEGLLYQLVEHSRKAKHTCISEMRIT